MNSQYIRNFCIVAHINHGKSTLADRLLELTHAVPGATRLELFLDKMELERERGITIKSQTVRLRYQAEDGKAYVLNLIDTPGHVDFTYEVSRSLAACEGALLVVDASQGVEAQTIANTNLALENNLSIIPIINKIDLSNADPERVKNEITQALGLDTTDALNISARTGEGVERVLEAIVKRVPPPRGDVDSPLRALVFDSFYDSYRGVIALIRVVDGRISSGMKMRMMATGLVSDVEEVGVFAPDMTKVGEMTVGEVGYVVTGLKDVSHMKVGDTVTDSLDPARTALPGYREPKPMVFAGLYPIDGEAYPFLRDALEKLKLNDASLTFEPESSPALGFGFRCGFLGLLHMEIVIERLEREYELRLLATAPHVNYRILKTGGEEITVNNPAGFPPPGEIARVEEPYVLATILTPTSYLGSLMELCQRRRGSLQNIQYLSEQRVEIVYLLPLAEIIRDFFNLVKSLSQGYATYDYEVADYLESDVVRLDILLGGRPVDALSVITHRDKAHDEAKKLVRRLKDVIPKHLFEVPIQAAIGKKVIARETIKALKKDVTAKLYGGDVTRKRKLLEKQKLGKKRMKKIGKVEVPQEAFLELLKVESSP